MIFHFLSLTEVVSAQARATEVVTAQERATDCNAVRRFVYPEADECDREQFCSDDFACVVTADCNSYKCVTASGCPEDTTYKRFSRPTEGDTFTANSLDGYYCAKDGLVCGFNEEGRFFIEAIVDNREEWNGLGTPDYRNISMISKTKFEANEGKIFKQFSKSSCFGELNEETNKILFLKDVNDIDCKNEMDFSFNFTEHNGQLWIIDFYIGYDDLWDTNVFGDEAIRRGGVANQFQCIMKASDTQFVDPRPDSGMIYFPNIIDVGEVPFDFTPYIDQEFTQVMPSSVDLSAGSYSTVDGLFIEGSSPEFSQDFIFHFKECKMSRHMFIGNDSNTGESVYAINTVDIYTFLFNGCINSTSNDFDQKETRVHWTEGTDLYAEDQIYVQFDVSGEYNESEGYKMRYACDMVLCDLDEIINETDETKPCFLADSCKNRYDNLINNRGRKRRSTENDTVPPQVFHKEGEIIVKGQRSNALQQAVTSAALIFFAGIFF